MKYREIDKENQSCLKKIIVSPKSYLNAKKKTSISTEEHFIFGDILDMLICGERKEFEEKYIKVANDVKCSDSIKNIIDVYFDMTRGSLEPLHSPTVETLLLSIAKNIKYGQTWKPETIINKIVKEGALYFKFLNDTIDKIPVSELEYSKVVNCLMALKSGEFTSNFMRPGKNVQFIDKKIILFEFLGVELKGELDRIVIDNDTKTIQPIDFKSTGKSLNTFQYDFWKFRYDFQAATYTIGLKKDPMINELIEKGYKLLNFLYIVVEKDLINHPQVFKISDDALLIGKNGGIIPNGKKVEGLTQAIVRLNWHKTSDKWDYPKEHYENGFLII